MFVQGCSPSWHYSKQLPHGADRECLLWSVCTVQKRAAFSFLVCFRRLTRNKQIVFEGADFLLRLSGPSSWRNRFPFVRWFGRPLFCWSVFVFPFVVSYGVSNLVAITCVRVGNILVTVSPRAVSLKSEEKRRSRSRCHCALCT